MLKYDSCANVVYEDDFINKIMHLMIEEDSSIDAQLDCTDILEDTRVIESGNNSDFT